VLVLDPRISYDGLRADFEGDTDLLDHLRSAKDRLNYYFQQNYANRTPSRQVHVLEMSSSQQKGSPQKDFAARYRVKDREVIDELQQYYKLSREDFDLCDPIEWWLGRRAQSPNLFGLARDILTIPGKLLYLTRFSPPYF
jgi:hypothetical protein